MWLRKSVSVFLWLSLFSALVSSQGVGKVTTREQTIVRLLKISAELTTELDKQVILSETQAKELQNLKTRLISVSESLTKANADLIGAANSLASLTKDFEDYKQAKARELKAAQNEVLFWKVGAIGMAISFVALAIYSAFN